MQDGVRQMARAQETETELISGKLLSAISGEQGCRKLLRSGGTCLKRDT